LVANPPPAQIVGLENYGTANTSETRELVHTHIEKLRRCECYRNARIVFIPESNLAGEANGVSEHLLNSVHGIRVASQKNDRYGCLTSQDTKRKFCFRFIDLLAHGAISYHSNIVSANPFISNVSDAERAKRSRMEFERQLRSFRKVHVMAPSVTANPYVIYSGKIGEDNRQTARLKDDMVMACILGIYWAGQYRNGLLRMRTSERTFNRDTGRTIAPVVRHTNEGGGDYAKRSAILEREHSVVPEAAKRRPTLAQQLGATTSTMKRRRA